VAGGANQPGSARSNAIASHSIGNPVVTKKWFMSFCSPTEHEKGQRLFTISFFPRSRGKRKKGNRKGSSDFDGSRDRIFEREFISI
jgi:hypothetical protein